MSSYYSTHINLLNSSLGLVIGYEMSALVEFPWYIVMLPNLQVIYAFPISNPGLPNMRGLSPDQDFR